MGALTELIASWRTNPSAELTIRVCSELALAGRFDWVHEVASNAEAWHLNDAPVMLAVGRMQLEAGQFEAAQSSLMRACDADSGLPSAFRSLGEALLRQGDAMNGQAALARAIVLGDVDSLTLALHERAKALIPMQRKNGTERVRAEIARAYPLPVPLTKARAGSLGSGVKRSPSRPPPANVDRPLPSFDLDAVEVSEVHTVQRHKPRATPARAGGMSADHGQARSAPSKPRGLAAPPPSRLPAREVPPPQVPHVEADEDLTTLDVKHLVSDSESRPSFSDVTTDVNRVPLNVAAAAALPAQRSFAPAKAAALVSSAPAARIPSSPAQESPTRVYPSAGFSDNREPSPAILLQHLARVGMFEPSGGAAPAWEAQPRERARGVWPLLAAIVLVAGGGVGGLKYAQKIAAERAQRAATLTHEVSTLLHSGRPGDLRATDQKLSLVFDLDSRSERAARLWLENRVLGALLLSDEPRGLDSAIHRGREVGLRERELAVGRVASFFVEGDLAGAAALLPKWDAEAGKDAYYQLAAGAVLERAGDSRALERYDEARALDPKLVPAELALARLLLLEYGVTKARPALDDLATKLPADDPNLRALTALTWVVTPDRPAEPPGSARLSNEDAQKLISPLRAVPAMVEAVEALAKGDLPGTSRAIESALLAVDGPALGATLGFLAIDAGNEALARKAALKSLSFAALYPRARTLAARVALLGGRLEEAQKAVEELDPKSSDVAIVRSVVAYETGNSADLASALSALDSHEPSFAALAAGPGVLLATRYPDPAKLASMASPSVPWGDMIAADAALDTGNLALAEKVLTARTASVAPAQMLRIARLRRYQKRIDDALTASQAALSEGATTPLIVERVLELVEKEKAAEARELVARYPALLGSVAQWLGVVIDVAQNQPKLATARLAQLEPPTEESPAFLRLLAGRALAMSGDKRGRAYVVTLVRRLGKNPEALAVAELLKPH
jgi:hypothetical protein